MNIALPARRGECRERSCLRGALVPCVVNHPECLTLAFWFGRLLGQRFAEITVSHLPARRNDRGLGVRTRYRSGAGFPKPTKKNSLSRPSLNPTGGPKETLFGRVTGPPMFPPGPIETSGRLGTRRAKSRSAATMTFLEAIVGGEGVILDIRCKSRSRKSHHPPRWSPTNVDAGVSVLSNKVTALHVDFRPCRYSAK